jgi:hypothetical protein
MACGTGPEATADNPIVPCQQQPIGRRIPAVAATAPTPDDVHRFCG